MVEITPAYGLGIGVALVGGWFLFGRKRKMSIRPNQNIVITGSTKGIGFALAKEFLKRGHNVIITSRNQDNVNNALNDLQNYKSFVAGCVSDVSDFDSIKKLSDFAISEFQNGTGRGEIDIWINNAGKSQPNLGPLKNVEPDEIASVINTNLIGSLYCTKVAINVMEGQEHGGHIFLMDGAGSNGMVTSGFACYGVSKAGLPQLLKTLHAEQKKTKVGIHAISPGMVITDLLMHATATEERDPKELKRRNRIFNILAEKPSTVASWLVPKVLSVSYDGNSGTYQKYLTTMGALFRFSTFWCRKNRLIDEETGTIKS